MKNDDNAIPDPSDQQIDLQSSLVLEVGKSTFTENAVSESGMTETTITSSVDTNANLGTIEYDTASSANIGDYMQLQLKDTSTTTNQIFSTYS